MAKDEPEAPGLDELASLVERYRCTRIELKDLQDLLNSALKVLKQREEAVSYKGNELAESVARIHHLIKKMK